MKPIILFNSDISLLSEQSVATQYFTVIESRSLAKDNLVVGRYSCLPGYKQLELDLKHNNSRLINSYAEHCYVANFEYYWDLEGMTPKTYFRLEDVPKNGGPYILKGLTNSRKHQWEHFFAKDFEEAVAIYCRLNEDPLISEQGIIIREYQELENFGHSVTGIPYANEWRLFFYQETLLSYGYYWSGCDKKPSHDAFDPAAIKFALHAATKVGGKVNFYVMDIAKTKEGKWIVIELNDGSQSGLSDNDPHELYKNLSLILSK